MRQDRVHVEMIGHATLCIRSGGRTLVTDPWLVDPIGAGNLGHVPPLVHDLSRVARSTDAIHLSHSHPDHFHRATLAAFPRDVPIYVGSYARKGFRDAIRALGFRVVELPFGRPAAIAGTDFEITPFEHDVAPSGYDSALVVRSPDFTLFANNDCLLRAETYRAIRERFAIDYAFLGYGSASAYPICFEMAAAEKERLLHVAAERRFAAFLEAASILEARLTVPYANGMRFLARRSSWKNVAFSSATEAVRRARAAGLAAEPMCPGDRLLSGGALDTAGESIGDPLATRHTEARPPAFEAAPPAAPATALAGRLGQWVVERWSSYREQAGHRPRPVIAYEIVGTETARCYFDFTRPVAEIFAWGTPPEYDMRYTYPAWAVQLALDGRLGWEELDFADGASIHQVRYAPEYSEMLTCEPAAGG